MSYEENTIWLIWLKDQPKKKQASEAQQLKDRPVG